MPGIEVPGTLPEGRVLTDSWPSLTRLRDPAWFKVGLHVELGEAGLTLSGWMMAP